MKEKDIKELLEAAKGKPLSFVCVDTCVSYLWRIS